jgi:hypothetical protein
MSDFEQFIYQAQIEYVYLLIFKNKTGMIFHELNGKKCEKMAMFENIDTLMRYAEREKINLIYIKDKP